MVRTFDLTDVATDARPPRGPIPGRARGKGPRRGKPKNALDGWIILDKPIGLTSTQALAAVKRLFLPQKAGHAGTLDPLASGLLPLALGEATKTVPFVVDGAKTYRFTVTWGAATDTDDSDGTVIATSDVRPTREAIEAALGAFIGEVSQVPPRYSAIKIDGQRAYDLAREGEVVELKPRIVTITRLEIVGEPAADSVTLEADCGKGTYVRSIARDLGEALGTRGHVSALRRTRVGPFGAADMITLEDLRALAADDPQAAVDRVLRRPSDALLDLPAIEIDRNAAGRLRRGQSTLLRPGDLADPRLVPSGDIRAMLGGDLVALCSAQAGELYPVRVFRNPRRRLTVPVGPAPANSMPMESTPMDSTHIDSAPIPDAQPASPDTGPN
ncbi:tRNA pseudouridine(55) synthase TruB [Acuticoccus mangrovi]|uniref:tRNA pseudouridine synthase B n=1 Tax=Acuticoccus mangrovi TaxID=2796142 RepID=A0A934IVK0_9HYPH|nr:tRNA pseudouridine(55) synthase TruB [Acuticoccus mangrovi]MBJ3778815.1 tRNA pseudouridine(55) synthase TruB [Acuticoccus mangrovi]